MGWFWAAVTAGLALSSPSMAASDPLVDACGEGQEDACAELAKRLIDPVAGLPDESLRFGHVVYRGWPALHAKCAQYDSAACHVLGVAYVKKLGVPPTDSAPTIHPLQQACKEGSDSACSLYEKVAPDLGDAPRVANVFLDTACEGGHLTSCMMRGAHALMGVGGSVDVRRAVELHEQACAGGNAMACGNLGAFYYGGIGVKTDIPHAVNLIQQSCDGGVIDSCASLASLLSAGLGVDGKDFERAAALNERACAQDNRLACYNLGLQYQEGQGVKKDVTRAAGLYRKACESNEATACHKLGALTLAGKGVQIDAQRARLYYQKAAEIYQILCERGQGQSCYLLGELQEEGAGFPADAEAAQSYFARAAEIATAACTNADASGCEQMRAAYELGRGVAKDKVRAKEMAERACELGMSDACGE